MDTEENSIPSPRDDHLSRTPLPVDLIRSSAGELIRRSRHPTVDDLLYEEIEPSVAKFQRNEGDPVDALMQTRSLVKIYDGRRVVDGVDINVRESEIVGLLGPNGAGKTTSFNMIVGLVQPDRGKVEFNREDATNLPMHRRARLGMGYLPQEESIFRKLTVSENIMAVLETQSYSSSERIDVESAPDPGKGYAIPPDNPFIGDASTQDEIWALGLRNPWRFSFDRQTGDLWIADVGQGALEEINFQPASSSGGENYGWRYFEGTSEHITTGVVPNSPIAPIHQYGRSSGRSVTGGYVYRGAEYPRMKGVYLYIDYHADTFIGIQPDGEGGWVTQPLLSGYTRVTTFGEDEAGELYFATDSSSSTPNRVFLISDIRDESYLKILSVEAESNGRLSFTFGSEIGESYQLQASNDLAEWNDLGLPEQANSHVHVFTEILGDPLEEEWFMRAVPLR